MNIYTINYLWSLLSSTFQVFLSVALILGDGLYNFVKIIATTIINIYKVKKAKKGSSFITYSSLKLER